MNKEIDRQVALDSICELLAEGECLREICRREGMPAKSAVLKWLSEDTALADQYARAREIGMDAVFDDILAIADDGRNDWMQRNDPNNPGYVANAENVQRSRVRIDARKWYLSKFAPKKYGDRQYVEQKTDLSITGREAETSELIRQRAQEMLDMIMTRHPEDSSETGNANGKP